MYRVSCINKNMHGHPGYHIIFVTPFPPSKQKTKIQQQTPKLKQPWQWLWKYLERPRSLAPQHRQLEPRGNSRRLKVETQEVVQNTQQDNSRNQRKCSKRPCEIKYTIMQ